MDGREDIVVIFTSKCNIFPITNLDHTINEPIKQRDNTTFILRKKPKTKDGGKAKVVTHVGRPNITPIDLTKPTPNKKSGNTKSLIESICRGLFIKNTHPDYAR